MNRKTGSNWAKHWDFFLLDMLCLFISFVLAYAVRHGEFGLFQISVYREVCFVLIIADILVAYIGKFYQGILRRNKWEELMKVVQHVLIVFSIMIVYLFVAQKGEEFSRQTMLMAVPLSLALIYIERLLWKFYLRHNAGNRQSVRALLLMAPRVQVPEILAELRKNPPIDVRVVGIILTDEESGEGEIDGIPVVAGIADALDYIQTNWVDGIIVSDERRELVSLLNECIAMGVTVHIKIERLAMARSPQVSRMGNCVVLTSSIVAGSMKAFLLKRLLDIVGGIFGCLLTGILYIFIAPIIYIKSPGPVMFKQERVGRGGKTFVMYKFRSMYMGAEEQKAELMEQNELEDDQMFKIKDDPRIIKGIGYFIRRTSLDEFPQFFNVLKGDMSLVGTRPPTLDEWDRYEMGHRKRMAIKPGITGLWQVSGRRSIVNVDEVVNLDTQYIMGWSLGLDLRIICKTMKVVLQGKDSY